jgi:hydrocephalus-inducing protein
MGSTPQSLKAELLFRMKVTASFINPLVEAIPPSLEFSVSKTSGAELATVQKSITLKNVSPLPLTPLMSSTAPFALLNTSTGTLGPGESGKVVVLYDPNLHEESHTHTDHGQLTISFAEHPHKEFINFMASVSFPNLSISPENIDFGCIVNNTNAHTRVVLANPGTLPVQYKWSLGDDDADSPVSQVRPPITLEAKKSYKIAVKELSWFYSILIKYNNNYYFEEKTHTTVPRYHPDSR